MEASVAAPPAQGAPPASSPPPASGQGQQQGQPTGSQGSDGGFWGRFPNVPEGQRSLLEPHLQEMQGYITRLEQQTSPYKSLMDSVPADQVQNLQGFLQQYQQDPLNTWMGMAQSLIDDGQISNPAFSIEQLQNMIAVQQQQAQPGQQQMPGGEEIPPWAQQMQAQLQQYQQAEQQRQAQAEAAQQEQMLGEAHNGMKQTLVAAGLPETALTTELMNGAIIANNGDVARATSMLTQMREAVLTGFTQANGSGSRAPTITGGPPQVPNEGLRSKGGDGFRNASIAAEQALKQSAAAGAQG